MPVPPGSLVGRNADLAVIEAAFARLRQGYGSAVVVLGEAGIGKTRLMYEARRLAHIGEVVLTGSASEFEGALPYGAFVGALDDYIQTVERSLLDTLDDDSHATLAALLPSYPAAPSGPRRGPVDAQYQAQRAARRLFESLAASKPHVVVLDDLHWADTATIAMISALLRRPPKGRALFLLALRIRQAPSALLSAIAEALRSGYAERVDLGPLTAAESRQLLDPNMSDERAQALHDASGGNPFYLEQLAQVASDPGSVRADVDRSDSDLPPLVAAALTEELETLDGAVREFLRGAAVVGDPFEAELAESTAGLSVGAAIDAIDDLLRRDMIRHTDVPRRFRFRHPLLRRAVYETTPGGWRLRAHERCASVLAGRGASPVALAAHFQYSGRHGDHRAIGVLTEAGEAVMSRAPLDAAHFFAAALRLTPVGAEDRHRINLGFALATAYTAGGRFDDAHAACVDTLARLGEAKTERYLEVSSLCALLDQARGNHAEAHARLEEALGGIPAVPTVHRVALLTQLSIDGFYALDLDAMAAWGVRARDDAVAIADDLRYVQATSLVALSAVLNGRIGVARATCRDAAKAADALHDDRVGEDPTVLSVIAAAEYYLDWYNEANAHMERAVRAGRASGRGQDVRLLYWSGLLRTVHGDLVQALDLLESAVEIARINDYSVGIAWNLSAQALVLSHIGDRDGALEAVREAAERTNIRSAKLPAELTRLAQAAVLIECGQPDQALRELSRCVEGAGVPGLPLRLQPHAYELATRCYLHLGDTPKAQRAAEHATAIADDLQLPTAVGFAQRAAAAVALAGKDLACAEQCALLALNGFAQAGAVIDAERTRLLLARILAASGQARRAIELLNVAASRFDACSAHALRAEAERELRKLGRRRSHRSAPPSHDGGALASLTGREREVATLVAQGKTNPQIAGELFLSTKTVESHVRNAFQKLHVTSRIELARLVDRAREEQS